MKTTQKELIRTATELNAIDITYSKFEEINKILKKEGTMKEVAYAKGIYGINSLLVKGYKTGKLYVIKSRTTALFQVL